MKSGGKYLAWQLVEFLQAVTGLLANERVVHPDEVVLIVRVESAICIIPAQTSGLPRLK